MSRRSTITKVVAGVGAAMFLLAPTARATEPATPELKQCVNGMPPPFGTDQWCVLVLEGEVIVGFESNRFGSPGHEDSLFVGVCSAPSPEWVKLCVHIPR